MRACHDLQGCCFVCTLNECKGSECCTSQGPPCLLGPLPFQLELVPSPAQLLSAGGKAQGHWTGSKNVAPSLCVRKLDKQDGTVDKLTTGTRGGDKGAGGDKGKLLVHIMYCNH